MSDLPWNYKEFLTELQAGGRLYVNFQPEYIRNKACVGFFFTSKEDAEASIAKSPHMLYKTYKVTIEEA
jgi:hypothetical protein